jgi:hypothetical protein
MHGVQKFEYLIADSLWFSNPLQIKSCIVECLDIVTIRESKIAWRRGGIRGHCEHRPDGIFHTRRFSQDEIVAASGDCSGAKVVSYFCKYFHM